jgi:hypothetical protein
MRGCDQLRHDLRQVRRVGIEIAGGAADGDVAIGDDPDWLARG